MNLTRTLIRLAAVALAFVLSKAQFQFFDCNKMPVLSVASGTLTLVLVYAIGEVIYSIAMSDRSTGDKFFVGGGVALGGAVLVVGAGFFTLITHMCP